MPTGTPCVGSWRLAPPDTPKVCPVRTPRAHRSQSALSGMCAMVGLPHGGWVGGWVGRWSSTPSSPSPDQPRWGTRPRKWTSQGPISRHWRGQSSVRTRQRVVAPPTEGGEGVVVREGKEGPAQQRDEGVKKNQFDPPPQENKDALMPDCGVHYLWFAFVCFLIRSHPPGVFSSRQAAGCSFRPCR